MLVPKVIVAFGVSLVLSLVVAASAEKSVDGVAQATPRQVTRAPEAVDWWTADAGGTSSGATFELRSTVGQPDAQVSSAGSYVLGGGFLQAGSSPVPVELQSFEIE